jgi:hypothetical protein
MPFVVESVIADVELGVEAVLDGFGSAAGRALVRLGFEEFWLAQSQEGQVWPPPLPLTKLTYSRQ